MVRSGFGAGRVVWVAAAMLFSVLLVSAASGENWPRFRGPNGQGISEAKGIPTKWSDQDYLWRIELPGVGHSSPVVWDEKVFVTCAEADSKRGIVLCLEGESGKELWRQEHRVATYPLNRLNNYASPTPAVDPDHVYVLWPGKDETILTALSHGGQEVWSATLGGVRARHGKGSSPIVHGDLVIVSQEQGQKSQGVVSQWLALDRRTGQIEWRKAEPPVTAASYSTPCVYQEEGSEAQLVFASNAHGLTGVNPDTGEVLWEVQPVLPARVVSSPVLTDAGILNTCGSGGRGKRLTVVRPGREGQAAEEAFHLETRIVPYVPTSVAYQGLVFMFHDGGVVSCVRVDTGRTLWSEKPAGRFFGSPICVSGVLYCITIDGDVVVLEAGPTYKLLAVSPLGEKSHATPAVGGGRLYLRTVSHLVALGGGG